MDLAIVLAILAGVAWAANIVVVRWGLDRTATPPMSGAFVGVAGAAVVALCIAVLSGQTPPAWGDTWRFALVGAIAPGSSQGLFVSSIGRIGPSRASVLVGTSPVFSVLLAILFLDEGWRVLIIVGTLLTVVGGAIISWEPNMLARRLGAALALLTALSFGVRDAVARQFNTGSDLSAWWTGGIVLGAGALVLGAILLVNQRGNTGMALRAALPEFLYSAMLIGLALPLLLAALDRGRVGVVAPLSLAAQNISVVILGAIVFGQQERTPRILAALGLVLLGAILVSVA